MNNLKTEVTEMPFKLKTFENKEPEKSIILMPYLIGWMGMLMTRAFSSIYTL